MRLIICTRRGVAVDEIPEGEIISAKTHAEINGEHSLTLVTTKMLKKGYRLLTDIRSDETTQRWDEYAIAGAEEEHYIGDTVIRTYYCPWSVQDDLLGILVSAMPGVQQPVTAQTALTALLSDNGRWHGTSTSSVYGGASMYDRSAWDALSTFLETWGGEIETSIEISEPSQSVLTVHDRKIIHADRIGTTTEPQARFDFGGNVASVTRTYSDAPLYCYLVPRGKGEKTEGGGYGRKINISSVNGGMEFLMYRPLLVDAELYPRIYPAIKVENSSCETPAELKAWAQGVLEEYCAPDITYTVDVRRIAGIDDVEYSPYGRLQLGDMVQVVDDAFGDERIELESRIVAIDRDLMDEKNVVYQISTSKKSIASKFSSLGGTNGTSYSNPSVSSAIGGVEPVSTSGISASTGINTNVCSLSLPAGVWMLCGQVAFPVNATGRRAAKISTTSGDSSNVISTVVQDAVTGALTRCSTSRCLSFATQTTVYLIGYQTSGETLSCSGQFEATRLA